MIIQSFHGGPFAASEYSEIKIRQATVEIEGENMTWMDAYKMLNRSERFTRLIFAIAKAVALRRLIHVPSSAILLYNALGKNPRWNELFFSKIGLGSRLCAQLFRFMKGLVDVTARQQPYEIGEPLPASCPDWLRTYYDIQAHIRRFEFALAAQVYTLT